jgi:hypothetical protein
MLNEGLQKTSHATGGADDCNDPAAVRQVRLIARKNFPGMRAMLPRCPVEVLAVINNTSAWQSTSKVIVRTPVFDLLLSSLFLNQGTYSWRAQPMLRRNAH